MTEWWRPRRLAVGGDRSAFAVRHRPVDSRDDCFSRFSKTARAELKIFRLLKFSEDVEDGNEQDVLEAGGQSPPELVPPIASMVTLVGT
jgi:hypothetical protein